MKAYLMGVVCAAFLCSIVSALSETRGGLLKWICGIFLVLALLHPLGTLELPDISADPFLKEAKTVVSEGREQAQTARNEIITESLEAYILTKAKEHGLTVEVSVCVREDGMPASVSLSGPASPLERDALIHAISNGLGIGKEDLIWNESYQSSE